MQFSIIFIDSEGSPTQELSAIEMDFQTREIVDVFHGYAFINVITDSFARRHIHGLNTDFLFRKGYENTNILVDALKDWIRAKKHYMCYGNNPAKEIDELGLYLVDIGLHQWIYRIEKPYQQVAFHFKRHNIPILSKRCCAEAHSSYQKAYVRPFSKTDAAKERYGYHCSLYDCLAMYLCYVTTD